jgi:2-hydroxychromene-2-carboxylate isomerase
MAFQNALLVLGRAALDEFGEEFLGRLVRALWEEENIVNERWAEDLLADSLGDDGREWLASRPEFRERI